MKKNKQEPENQKLTTKLAPFLYLTAAINGGVILIVEILGAKMLSPFFGTSHFVWTAQITATLISLACGYYYGGWIADKKPNLSRLYYCMLCAALYLAFATLALEPVAYFFLKFKLAMGSILMALFLFFPPLTLLAVTIPFLARITTETTQSVGLQVGRLSAISTVGSVIGTLLISYLLIPLAPNTYTMIMVVALEIVLVAVYFLVFEKGFKQTPGVLPGILAGMVICGIAGRVEAVKSPSIGKELFRKNSNFGLMQVVDSPSGDVRYYLNDYLTQNIFDPKEDKSLTVFTYMLRGLTHAYHPSPEKVLCIGLGVGIVPMQLAKEGSTIDVVEINPGVVEIGEKFFGLDKSKFNLHLEDGRYFLNASKEEYDVVILDAFLGDSSPSHLMSRECFESMSQRMKTDAVLVINAFGHFSEGEDFFMASLDKTLRAVFKSVHIHDGTRGNVFFVASKKEGLEPHRSMDMSEVHPKLIPFVETAWKNTIEANPESGIILTDNYNPVEYYDSKIREEIRLNFALNMRGK
ncbi:MAG: fused MFS/spermidine synthase [Verrucomicrobiota bacterium]|nr:fused MFS/spermidine synthase [Verrucomicrobiota bacterium]